MRWTGLFLLCLCIFLNSAASGQSAVLEQVTTGFGIVEIFLAGGGKVKTESFVLTSPERIVIDLDGVRCNAPGQIAGEGRIKQVRYSQFSPGVTRVVLDLDQETSYDLVEETTAGGRLVRVCLAASVSEIQLLETEPLPTLQIKGSGKLEATSFYLSSPERLVIDLANATLAKGVILPDGKGPVARVRASQFRQDIVRVVLDLSLPLGGMIQELPGEIQLPLRHQLQKIYWQDGQLHINTMGPKSEKIARTEGRSWLEFPLTAGTNINLPKGPSGFALTAKQEDSWFLGVECPGKRIKLVPKSNGLILQFLSSALAGVVVVVDPGHGGADPGAIGPTGLREKDINLAISKTLVGYLEEYGAKVQLTRSGDYYVSLAERVALSHSLGAKIFISIHCNSFGDSNKQGVETFYSAKGSDGKLLAQYVQNQLVSLRPSLDRGAKVGNLYVIRENLATSVLTEVAFISNPQEEALLADPDYQQKVGRAIADGIEAFLEENQR